MKSEDIIKSNATIKLENSIVNKFVIECDNICLFHNSLGISIPIPNEKIECFEAITINGITFKKEVLE